MACFKASNTTFAVLPKSLIAFAIPIHMLIENLPYSKSKTPKSTRDFPKFQTVWMMPLMMTAAW